MITAGYSEPWLLWMVAAYAGTSMSSSPNPEVTDRQSRNDLTRIGVDVVDISNIAIVDLLVVVVLVA